MEVQGRGLLGNVCRPSDAPVQGAGDTHLKSPQGKKWLHEETSFIPGLFFFSALFILGGWGVGREETVYTCVHQKIG